MTCPACGIDPSLLLAAHAVVRVRADREQNPDLDRLAHQLRAAVPERQETQGDRMDG